MNDNNNNHYYYTKTAIFAVSGMEISEANAAIQGKLLSCSTNTP